MIDDPPNSPVLSKSLLGWSFHGNLGGLKHRIDSHVIFHVSEYSDGNLHEMVKQSFQTENFGVVFPKKPLFSDEEERAQRILDATTKRVGDRWETGLLWLYEYLHFPDSYSMALSRLKNIEKQMRKDPSFRDLYNAKIKVYISKGYAREVNINEMNENTKTWYIPHFGVSNIHKPGKLRLVFDAAAKSNGTSLNDALLFGPDLLKPLVGVLCKFRQKEFGFTGDIAEMFHRVLIRDEDLPAQKFLWSNGDPSRAPDIT